MNKTLKSIVMMFIICALGYTQIGCKADNIKNENPQAIKDYSNQVQSEDKSNQNSNESKDDNGNLTSQVEKLSSNAEIHFIDTGNSDTILIIKDNKAVAETITRAVCTISGKDYTLPIKSVTVEGAKFKVNIYLDDTLSGTVTNTKLYDKDGNLLIQRQDVVPKPEEKNLLVVFQLELREVAL